MPSKASWFSAIVLLSLFILLLPQAVAQDTLSIDEFRLPNGSTSVDAMAIDSGGNVWLAQSSPAILYQYDARSGAFVKHPIPTVSDVTVKGMSAEDGQYIWMAAQPDDRSKPDQVIGYDIALNKFYNFTLPLKLDPTDVIAQEPYLWVGCNMELSRINMDTNFMDDYYVDKYNAGVSDMAVDRLGNVWFVEYASDKVGGYYKMNDALQLFPIPTAGAKATYLAVDSRSKLWFIESGPNKLGMFDTNQNSFAELDMPVLDGLQAYPKRIAVDGDDNVWLSDMANNRLIKYYPSKNVFVPIALNGSRLYPTYIGVDNGDVWFLESGTNTLVKLHADSLYGLNPTPTPTATPTAAPNSTATPTPKPTPGFEMLAVLIALFLALAKKTH
jgi:virginiamycin B lyase